MAPPRDDVHAIPSIAALRCVVLGIRMITNRYSAFTFSSILFATCLALTACTDDGTGDSGETETGETETGETGEPGELAIAGMYTDEWGDAHTITDESWTNAAGSFEIAEYDNEQMYALAQNAETNEYFPALWSRFDWAWDGDTLYYCQSVFDGESIDVARAGAANAADLELGCGGFAWTRMD